MSNFYLDDRNGNKIPVIIHDAANLILGSYELTQVFLKVVSSAIMRSMTVTISQVVIEIGRQVVATEYAIYQQQLTLRIKKFETTTDLYAQAWKDANSKNYPDQFKEELKNNLIVAFQQDMAKIRKS